MTVVDEPVGTVGEILPILRRTADNPSAFLALNQGNEYFTAPGIDGVVTYRPFGNRYWIQFAGASAAPERRGALDAEFAAAASAAGRRVIAVQLMRGDALRAAANGWTVNQFGTSYSIDLADFSLRGRKFVKTRNMITRSRREGVTVSEVDPALVRDRLAEIDASWLRDKGWHVKEMRFLIGEREGPGAAHRRTFVATAGDRVVAYVSYAPVFGSRPGWLYDLTRRSPDAPPGVIEHIFAEAAETLRADGAGWLHLGLTPFVGRDQDNEIEGAANKLTGRLVDLIERRGAFLYPAAGQLAFKLKWRPQVVTPEYVAFPGRIRVRDIWCLARATNAL